MTDPSEVGIVFWVLSTVILVSAVMVVSLRNIFHCAIFLILTLTGVAGIFVTLNAEFLAAAQVLIYVGAVATLMVFGIMLTSDIASRRIEMTNQKAGVAVLACMVFALGVLFLIKITTKAGAGVWQTATEPLPADNVLTIGKQLMTEFVLPFEVVSVLLLAAMIGAIVLARREAS
ncbi:MAG: NADH-quinone oxidoreductase subunit J [candidate division Zixibacteria bacterium]|nr:NADH-quinone oxidoreductase subunit J [candidate division Zixibacteria bacterium]